MRILLTIILSTTLGVSCMAQPTAKQWNREVLAGWNLGNQFECSTAWENSRSMDIGLWENSINAETAWGNPKVTRKTIKAIKDAGFNAIRIPIRWQCHITNPQAMSIDKAWIKRIKEVINWCLDCDMKVMINTHHDQWLEGRPKHKHMQENCQKLALLWFNIASEFADYDYRLAFAGTNEVHEPDNWGKPTAENLEVQNAYNQTFIDVVRATGGNNVKRHLIVQTYVCNPDFGLYNGDFIIPTDIEGNGNDYMSVEFHYYTPWEYAGEGKFYYWGEQYRQFGDVPTSNEQAMVDLFNRADSIWGNTGLGVIIGEWGVSDHYKSGQAEKIHENMTYYCQFLVSEARKRGFSTFIWDNNSFGNGMEKFGIFDRKHNMSVKTPWILQGIMQGCH